MARKSRKSVDTMPECPQNTQPTFDAGAYVRLSAVDRLQKGDSIETQQAIINAYVADHPDLRLREVYIDNGISGMNFDRPAFQQMLTDAENGKINCILSKDLSRLGRNAIDTGAYIEQYFPLHSIRYIAINDNYDSADGYSNGVMVSMKNILNEAYALEVGRKIHTTKQMNIRNGAFVGRIPPYGYMKSGEDNHKLVMDTYAAANVRQIFQMAADGRSVAEIVRYFNGSEVLPPFRYFHTKGLVSEKEADRGKRWGRGIIYSILHNRVYCGDMVQGKNRTKSYIEKLLPKSEWIITENTHEAIISRELFALVQRKWETASRTESPPKTPCSKNIFLRKIFCGHCGYTMRRAHYKRSYGFKCETRLQYHKDDCGIVSINENKLKARLLELIRENAPLLDEYETNAAITEKSGDSDAAALREIRREIGRNSGYLKGLYESLAEGIITTGEYREMKQSYEAKLAALAKQERQLYDSINERVSRESALVDASDTVKSLTGIADITADVIDRLVDRILVFEDGHIEIQFRFVAESCAGKGELQQ